MSTAEKFRDFAAECVQKASGTENPEEKNLHLNMALAWIRLAQQSEAIGSLAEHARELHEEEEGRAGLEPNGGL
jgi:hypothetical protein